MGENLAATPTTTTTLVEYHQLDIRTSTPGRAVGAELLLLCVLIFVLATWVLRAAKALALRGS